MTRYQNRSSYRKGEPLDHKLAKENVGERLARMGWTVYPEYPLVNPMIKGYQHNYDVVGFGRIVVVEVDDADLHSKPFKRKNDKVAENSYRQYFPDPQNHKFLRLDKDEVNNKTTELEYFRDHFYPYV